MENLIIPDTCLLPLLTRNEECFLWKQTAVISHRRGITFRRIFSNSLEIKKVLHDCLYTFDAAGMQACVGTFAALLIGLSSTPSSQTFRNVLHFSL